MPTGIKLCSTTSFFSMPINKLLLAQNMCGTPKEKYLSILSLKNNIYTIVSLVIIQKQG